jgi:integrase
MARKRRGRSEGSIFQRSDGLWVGTISLGYDGAGKRRRRTVYADSKADVQAKVRALQTSADAGALPDAGRITVGEYVNHWLEHTARPAVRATTYQRYEQLARLHVCPSLGAIRLGNLRAEHVERFYSELEKSGSSGRSRQACGQLLTAALKHAVERKRIPFNPAAGVKKARPDHREMTVLSGEQVQQLLAASLPIRLRALLSVAVGTGMRLGEILGLKWEDIDLKAGTIGIRRSLAEVKEGFLLKEPKSKRSRRTITLPRFVSDALVDHRAAMMAEGNIAAVVFCTRTGQYISRSNFTAQVFKPLLKRAGLPRIRFHDLRHTHASHLLSQGKSARAVSERLGHASVKITLEVYGHVLPGDDAQLAESVNRLFG